MKNYDYRALLHAEKYGICEYFVQGNKMIYYSFFGRIEGFYKIIRNLDADDEQRIQLKTNYKTMQKKLDYKYNYFVG